MLSCKEVSLLVSESLDHKLSWRQRMGLWMHVRMCRLCNRFRRQLLTMHEQIQSTPEPPEASDLASRLRLSPEARRRIEARLTQQRD